MTIVFHTGQKGLWLRLGWYSIVPIKRTVLLNVLFQKIPNVSIKRTVFSEKW